MKGGGEGEWGAEMGTFLGVSIFGARGRLRTEKEVE